MNTKETKLQFKCAVKQAVWGAYSDYIICFDNKSDKKGINPLYFLDTANCIE